MSTPRLVPVAEDVWHIPLAPRDALNVYVVGDVLVDAGIRSSGAKIVAALAGRPLAAHVLTHAHPDHVGGSRYVVDTFGVPCWATAGDAAAVRSGVPVAPPRSRFRGLIERPSWDGVPVARELREGDDVAGFTVLDVPGHSPGHVALWREGDRTLIGGDVFFNIRLLTLRPGLRPPLRLPTVDPAQNRRSMRRLAELRPETMVFGHGPVLRNAAPALEAAVARLT